MIHYRNRQTQTALSQASPISTNTELESPHVLDTNIVCMYTKADADCPNIIKSVKTKIESNLADKSYSKYANFPSCSGEIFNTIFILINIFLMIRIWLGYSLLG